MIGRSVSGWVRRAVALALVSVVSASSGRTAAQSPKLDECQRVNASALSALACELSRALADVPAPAVVVSAPLKSDVTTPKQDALTARLANVVAGRLGRGARADGTPSDLHQALRSARAAKALVYLTPEFVGGELRVTADAFTSKVRFWDRVANPEPSPAAHGYSARRADAEIRTFLPAVTLVAHRIDHVPTPEQTPVAIACGDVGADGSPDIVLVGRRRVLVGRLSAGKFVSDVTRDWSDLSPVAPSPLREPLGTAAILPNGAVDVALSDRASGFRLDGRGTTLMPLPLSFPWPGGGCASRTPTGLAPSPVRCAADDDVAVAARDAAKGSVDAIAGAVIAAPDGAVRLVRASRSGTDDAVTIFDDARHSTRLAPGGAQIAVGDLDGDGTAELVVSKDTLEPSKDGVSVYSWTGSDTLARRFEVAVPAGVRAVAVCPWLGDGMSPLVIAASNEVMVIR
jgi:hypothetical protein